MSQSLLVGLDIGSSRIRLAMGQIAATPDRTGSTLSIVGAVEAPSAGISKGSVSALEDAVAAISSALEQGERHVGAPIEEAIVGINGTHTAVMPAKGVVGVARPDGEIREEDLERVLESAKGSANPANVEIIHVLPHGFIVDGAAGIRDPLGMHGIRIEATAHLVTGLAGNVRNLTKAVLRTGIDVSELVFGPLAAANTVTNARERELGVCVVTIGAGSTAVCVFEEGELLHAKVLPIGADHVTSDIAIGLRTSLEAAEAIKLAYGHADPEAYGKREEIDIGEFGADASELVSLRFISEIIRARTEEMFEKVEAELRSVDRSGLLPAGAVLTGGGAKQKGIVEVAKQTLRLPASIGASTHLPTSIPELVYDPSFATAVGLVQWGFEEMRKDAGPDRSRFMKQGGAVAGRIGGAIRNIFKSFVP
jgi:cell division protein FtsA